MSSTTLPAQVQPDTDYTGLLTALDRASGHATDECFPDLRPTVLEIVRACPPSAELVELLTRLTLESQRDGKHDLAAECLSLALCARSARRADRPLG